MTTPDEEKKETGVQLVEQVSNDKEKSQDWIKQEIEWLQQQVESKKNSWEIKEQVENERYWKNKLLTYEILEWTSLKWTMLKIIADPIFDKNVVRFLSIDCKLFISSFIFINLSYCLVGSSTSSALSTISFFFCFIFIC